MYDSVFSAQLPKNKLLTSEKTIAKDLNEIEAPSIKLFSKTFDEHINKAVTALSKAIASKDEKAIKDYKWGLNIELGQNLWGEWLLGWNRGIARGDKEINKAQSLALFAQPEAEATIRNVPAEKAIKKRINTLAQDVSNSEWKQIKSSILDAIKPQSPNDPPISRNKLLKRINATLGDRKNRFRDRAQTIARTELTAAYNTGRLDTYVRSGLVEAVKYQTIFDDRRCEVCQSRQGLIVPLDDIESIAKITPPLHPRCRCVLSPVLKTEFEREGQKEDRRIEKRNLVTTTAPWAIAAILAAVLVAGRQPAGVTAKVKDIAIATAVRKISTAQTETVPQEEEVKAKVPFSYPVALASSTATREEIEERLKRYQSNLQTKQETPVQIAELLAQGRLSQSEINRLIQENRITQQQINDIRASLRQQLGRGGSIVPIADRSKIAQARQSLAELERKRSIRLKDLNNNIDLTENKANGLKELIVNDVRTASTAARDLINESASSVVASQEISNNLIAELNPVKPQILQLNRQIKQLEDKLAALLDPNVEDYFFARTQTIDRVREEIQNLRGQLNQINQYANSTISQARNRHSRLLSAGKSIAQSLPNYSDLITDLQNEAQDVLSRLIVETQLAEGKSAGVSSLRAKYRRLQEALSDLNELTENPLRDRLNDKRNITTNVNRARKETAKLSNRLSRLEDKIENLPSRINQLSPSRRQEYRKLRTSITTTPDYIIPSPPTRVNAAVRAKASRLARQGAIDETYEGIIAQAEDIRNVVDRNLSQKTYKGKSVNYWADKTLKSGEDIYLSYRNEERLLNRSALSSASNVQIVEENIEDLVKAIVEDIENPLAKDWFNSQGRITNNSRDRISLVRRKILKSTKKIDDALKQFKRLQNRVSSLFTELKKIRRRVGTPVLNPLEKAKLDRQIELLNTELKAINRAEVNFSYYRRQIPAYLKEIEAIKAGNSPRLKSIVLTRLDDLEEITSVLERQVSVANNVGVYTSLEQAKQRLFQARKRLNSLPKKTSNLRQELRQEWTQTRQVRQSSKKAIAQLDDLLDDYREDALKVKSQLNATKTNNDRLLADIETGTYAQNRAINIETQQQKIKSAMAELDENLALMEFATDKDRGLALVYDDLKRIYRADIPGLEKKPDFAIGLDEALEVKRKIVKTIERNGFRVSERIKKILATNTAKATTRYKLSVVDEKIKELEKTLVKLRNQKAKVDRLNNKLTEIHQIDPITHRQLKPNRLAEEIQANTINARNKINKELDRLRLAKAQLQEDLNQTISYSIRDRKVVEVREGVPVEINKPTITLDSKAIASEVDRYRTRIKKLTATRRPQLEQVGLQLKNKRIKLSGTNSITENLKTNHKLTPGQQKAFNALTSEQQELLVDASRTGVIDLYEDLYRLSVTRGKLELDDLNPPGIFTRLGLTDTRRVSKLSLKTQKWNEVSKHLTNLRNLGYEDVAIELGEDSVRLLNVPNLPPRASGSRFARYQLRQLISKLGVNQDGSPLPLPDIKIRDMATGLIALDDASSFSYQEIMKAISANRQMRYESHNRLEAFNFNRNAYVIQFNLSLARGKTPSSVGGSMSMTRL